MTDREDSTGYDFNYETGLEKLWGEEALKTLRKMILHSYRGYKRLRVESDAGTRCSLGSR